MAESKRFLVSFKNVLVGTPHRDGNFKRSAKKRRLCCLQHRFACTIQVRSGSTWSLHSNKLSHLGMFGRFHSRWSSQTHRSSIVRSVPSVIFSHGNMKGVMERNDWLRGGWGKRGSKGNTRRPSQNALDRSNRSCALFPTSQNGQL